MRPAPERCPEVPHERRETPMRPRAAARAVTVLCAGVLLLGAACGGDDSTASAGDKATSSSTASSYASSSSTAPAGTATTGAAPSGAKTKPEFEIPPGDPPKQLQIKDLEVGTGAEAKS